MPIYEYQAKEKKKSCDHCAECFDVIQQIADPHVAVCPKCSSRVVKPVSMKKEKYKSLIRNIIIAYGAV